MHAPHGERRRSRWCQGETGGQELLGHKTWKKCAVFPLRKLWRLNTPSDPSNSVASWNNPEIFGKDQQSFETDKLCHSYMGQARVY